MIGAHWGIVASSGAVAVGGFTPDDIAGLQLWLDASQITGLADGDPVTTWTDSSGEGNDASPSGNTPIYKASIVNGKPVVRCNAAVLSGLVMTGFMSSAAAAEIFIVLKTATLDGVNCVFDFSATDPTLIPYADSIIYDGWGSTSRKTTGIPATSPIASFILYNVSSAAGAWTSRINGTQHFTTTSNTVGFRSTFTLGHDVSLSYGWSGDIAEILIYDSVLSTTNRQAVEQYLLAKYLPPLTITGLKLWLKADSLALTDGAAVATWVDNSGLGNNATQATSGAQPIYKTSILNGKPVVRFDAVDDALSTSCTIGNPFTVFVVYNLAAVVTGGAINGQDNGHNWAIGGTGGNHICYNGAYITGPAISVGVFILACVVQTGSGAELFVNGTSHGTDIPTTTPGNLMLGRLGAYYYLSVFSGDIAEVLVYDSVLGSTDRTTIETYLKGKYGLTPYTVPGLKLWLAADQLVGLSDGAPVTTWSDSSGLGNNATQATSGAQPIYKTNIVNGKPVVRFDGSDDYLTTPALFPSSCTVFLVAKRSSSTGMSIFEPDGGLNTEFYYEGGGDPTFLGFYNGSLVSVSFTTQSFHLLQFDRLGSVGNARIDGGAATTGSIWTATGTSVSYIGRYNGSAVNFLNGDIAEILIYDSVLGSTDRTTIETYLKGKYAL